MCTFPAPFPAAPWPKQPAGKTRYCFALVLCAVFIAAFAPASTAATDLEIETTRNGELIEIRARATVNAPLSVVWGTLTDYERLPEFIPGLKKSRVISRVGATATIEQSGEARFLFLSVPIEVTLESTERPPNIEVRRIAGTVRYLQGRYETQPTADPGRVQLRWTGAITPETDLPPLIGETLMRLSIGEQFSGMVAEIERREALRQQGAWTPGRSPAPRATAPSPATRSQNQTESPR